MTHATATPGTLIQHAQWGRRHIAKVPAKPDPDVMRIVVALRRSYGDAKLLKALSYGVPVDVDLAAWCLGRKADVAHVIAKLRKIHPHMEIEYLTRQHAYMIRDDRALAELRRIMGGIP